MRGLPADEITAKRGEIIAITNNIFKDDYEIIGGRLYDGIMGIYNAVLVRLGDIPYCIYGEGCG